MFLERIKIPILFCLLILASSAQAATDSKLNSLLERAKARKTRTLSTHKKVKEERGYIPAQGQEIKTDKTVPKEKSYDELVDEFNNLFDETKTQIKEHEEKKPVTPAPVIKEKPKKIIKTTAKTAPVVKKETSQVKVETKNEVSQSANKTQASSQSEVKAKPKVEEEHHVEEEVLDEDEYEQEHHHGHETEDEEEDELDEDEGLVDVPEDHGIDPADMPEERRVISKNMVVPRTQAERTALYLDIIKKSLKSLEEDPWNEVKFNMSESMKYFEKEKTLYNAGPINKFHEITLAFLRFSEGGLELDQGDFADFEDAEAHYLDSQDLLDAVELKLKAKDTTDQELLKIIQTVKKYINEDIEYIEEMIDLS